MSDSGVSLTVLHGKIQGKAVAEVVSSLLTGSPSIVWCEPTPARKRVEDFVGLWAGDLSGLPEILKSTPLDEARLFWDKGWIHVLAGKGRVRLAAFHEEGAPPWLAPIQSSLQQLPKPWESLRRVRQDVLLIRDLKRYNLVGLKGRLSDKQKLGVIEYHEGTNLVGWRLEVKS